MPGLSSPSDERAPFSTRLKLPLRYSPGSQPQPQPPSPTSATTIPTTTRDSTEAARYGGIMDSLSSNGHAYDVRMDRHSDSLSAPGPDASTSLPPESHVGRTAAGDALPAGGKPKAIVGGDGTADQGTPSTTTSSQQQLNEYRERLARDLERRELSARRLSLGQTEKPRVSPIQEENAASSPPPTVPLATTSTESGHTIRGGMTPAQIMGTPSYPFPRMASGTYTPSLLHRPFTTLSPTGSPHMSHPNFYGSLGMQDQVLSDHSTPASTFAFNPTGTPHRQEQFDFPNPNLYDLSLMLSAEPGLDAWWATVVQIMRDVYKAERITLAVPADTTDLENVPWGQKATYNEHQEDELSLGYMAGTSGVPSSDHDITDAATNADNSLKPSTALRPGLPSRHSFTSFEENKQKADEKVASLSRRPSNLLRSRSYRPSSATPAELPPDHAQLNKNALDEHDAGDEQQNIPEWEVPFANQQEPSGRVLPVLQALDYEADPLIDHTGVMRVLERGRAVALTRSYPYLANSPPSDQSVNQKPGSKSGGADPSKKSRKVRSESMSKLSSILPNSAGARPLNRGKGPSDKSKGARFEEDIPRPTTPKYEEYEQGPSSPWSQSPAPSPAIRLDPKENPFFTDAMVDEESFNPGSAPTDYTGMRPPQAIGIDNSWTVLHIPLTHVLVSKPTNIFKLDSTALEQKSSSREREEVYDEQMPDVSHRSTPESSRGKNRIAPVAILSVLSPIIPYPNNLRHSLEHLAPHMATSFSLCRQYTNLETELAGIQRRRPTTAGFGAVAADGIPMTTASYLSAADIARQQSVPGSMTSPSDYSAVSKSATGSPAGTPGWDQGSLSFLVDKRQPAASPAAIAQGGDGYFSSKARSGAVRQELRRADSQRSRPGSKDNSSSPSDKRHSRLPSNPTAESMVGEELRSPNDSVVSLPRHVSYKDLREAGTPDESMADMTADPSKSDHGHSYHGHTKLHSYGADFASTFQSLPPSSTLAGRPQLPASLPSRSGSVATSVADMPPPSDKLKGLMLDSLPAHVFVALPQTGEIVWVNSRYLSYRGQTVSDLSADPWSSIHQDDREEYLRDWARSVKTGEQFSRTVRIKRFDGAYRWFYARAVASKDKRGVIMQFLGSYMDIHDQHIAELKAARQEEIEASEAKHRLLANLIPQIIFTATEEDGITFANEQWLSYTGQSFADSLGLGFMDFVHPEDLAKCRIPTDHPPTPMERKREPDKFYQDTVSSPTSKTTPTQDSNLRGVHQALSRNNSSSSGSVYELPTADLTELARKGIIKVGTDSNGRLSYTTEVRLRSKSGEYRWHLIRCVEIDTIDFGSGASSYFGSATDINDHKLLEVKLKEAMESKGRFLSNMSHEIRTPLIGISGMVTFLQDTKLNEEQRDYTNTIQTSANSLIMIINDILDLSKVDAGMMKLKFEWFHTRSLIEDVNELVSTMAIAKGLELNYLVEADVPAWVKGDKVRVRQVLLNVIGNAIKFTAEGEVFSRCRVSASEGAEPNEHEIMLEFAITDTGRGFSKKEAELIFKPFSQIDGSSTRQHGGSGLGLVISRQLVELHGGHMEGSAIPGRGSTFSFTARFTLPTAEDHPSLPDSPDMWATSRQVSPATKPVNVPKLPRSIEEGSPSRETTVSSPTVTSTGSSNPSVHSGRSLVTDRSSVTSVNTGLARFSEAAKASGQDLSQMKLEMPSGRSSPGRTVTPGDMQAGQRSPEDFRPPMYSILILCPQYHSREATTAHIEMTLPKDVPHQITALATVEEAQKLIGGEDPIKFTHIVINLGSAEAIIDLLDRITKSQKIDKTIILILSDSVQRQAVMKLAADTEHEKLLTEDQVTFIYKPVKPSRFAVIFDPDKVQDLSIDRNRSTAQRMVENQKASYQEIEKRMGNKGYKVLLVEDNPVNQKVLMKYLKKIGVDVEVAVDGVECTDTVLSKPHEHYSLILCDLHMPRKDGYQACREIRAWEKTGQLPKMPIIALSANVMSDVQEKCVAAGFSDYVTKPVDFIDLSRAMAKFF